MRVQPRVSGTPTQNVSSAAAAQTARKMKAAEYPAISTTIPATPLLRAAPIPQQAPLAPRARL